MRPAVAIMLILCGWPRLSSRKALGFELPMGIIDVLLKPGSSIRSGLMEDAVRYTRYLGVAR